METPARVNIKQPWQQVTSVTPRGLRGVCLKRSTVVRWCFGVPQRLIWTVDVLRYIALSHLWESSSETALVRIRVVFSHYAVNTLEVQTCKCRNPLITNRSYVLFLWKLCFSLMGAFLPCSSSWAWVPFRLEASAHVCVLFVSLLAFISLWIPTIQCSP